MIDMNDPVYLPRTMARVSPASLAHYIGSRAGREEWVPYRHLMLLDEHLGCLAFGEIDHLIVEMPPRHGLSTLVSGCLPSWWLARKPYDEVLLVSANDLGGMAARTWEYAGASLESFHSFRIGADLGEHRANLLIIDTPISDTLTAESDNARKKLWHYWQNELQPRLRNRGKVVVAGHRWRKDDFIGCLRVMGPHRYWKVLSLPAFAGENDPLGRKPGEALCSSHPLMCESKGMCEVEELDRKKREMGHWFDAIYQQKPTT